MKALALIKEILSHLGIEIKYIDIKEELLKVDWHFKLAPHE